MKCEKIELLHRIEGDILKKIIQREISKDHDLAVPGMHPLLQRIYLARGITSPDDLEQSLKSLLPCSDLLGIDAAVQCLISALNAKQRILIIGDFDVDGATSTALAVRALRIFGFEHVSYLVPSRFEFGYGLSPEIVMVAARENPDLIITVDNGISSIPGVSAAKKLGIDVLVTDHHLPGGELPEAVAIVNPCQPHDEFQSKNLAGVGVIFYLMLALRSELRAMNWFAEHDIAEPNMGQFLDLVALGTVADVVSLDKNNRILVRQGLLRIRSEKCCAGIKALLATTGRDCRQAGASDLGFVLGPRLNAAGRLDDMSLGIECLLTDDAEAARDMAMQLNILNDERKAIEADMRQEVQKDLDELELSKDLPLGLCLFNERWHQGVVGILASRIKDCVHRPVIAFAKINENEIKGSARSIPGLHLRDVLENIAKRKPDLISKYGGHAMAAGLSLPLTNYQDFCQEFVAELEGLLSDDDLQGKVYTDGELEGGCFNLDMAELLRSAGPWGQGFPEPVFEGIFNVRDQRLLAQRHLKLMLNIPGTERFVQAIAFNIDTQVWPNERAGDVRIVYRMDVNEYRGRRELQLIVQHLEAA